ncbi:hypothetical protein [Vibrio barjaei]|jgi:hypothetical protein|uniref:hypothetical protein n=1 Tax=Vibrio barjaei TaxID=1676683 RepID=UPI0037491606
MLYYFVIFVVLGAALTHFFDENPNNTYIAIAVVSFLWFIGNGFWGILAGIEMVIGAILYRLVRRTSHS